MISTFVVQFFRGLAFAQKTPDNARRVVRVASAPCASFGQQESLTLGDMSRQTVLNFVDAINEHNVEKICSLMTDDHKFIDSQGNAVVGKVKMRAGWTGYF